jgi:hypothetical protein
MAPKQADVATMIAESHQPPHFGLSQIERTRPMGRMTPLEVWSDARHRWTPGVDLIWTVAGVSIRLS